MADVIKINFAALNGGNDEKDEWSYSKCTPDEDGDWFIGDDDAIYYNKPGRNGPTTQKVTGQPIYIQDRAIDMDSGMESITVVWKNGAETEKCTLPRRNIFTGGGVMELANRGYAVHSGNSQRIVLYLAHLLEYHKKNIPIRHVVSTINITSLTIQ